MYKRPTTSTYPFPPLGVPGILPSPLTVGWPGYSWVEWLPLTEKQTQCKYILMKKVLSQDVHAQFTKQFTKQCTKKCTNNV